MTHDQYGQPINDVRFRNAGFRGPGWGENVAKTSFFDIAMIMNGWMNSPGHRANILRDQFTHFGSEIAHSETGFVYWTQHFGVSDNETDPCWTSSQNIFDIALTVGTIAVSAGIIIWSTKKIIDQRRKVTADQKKLKEIKEMLQQVNKIRKSHKKGSLCMSQ